MQSIQLTINIDRNVTALDSNAVATLRIDGKPVEQWEQARGAMIGGGLPEARAEIAGFVTTILTHEFLIELMRRERDEADPIHCDRCNAVLNSRKAVWLELNNRTNEWAFEGAADWSGTDESQGCFAFGPRCAAVMLRGRGPGFPKENECVGGAA